MTDPIIIALAVVAAIVVLFVVVVAMRPSNFVIQRSGAIAAPPSEVFAQVNDFHQWDAWSPWAKIDPMMKTTYGGQPSGVGANYHWSGNSKAGEGRMTIIESLPATLIRIKLEFMKPFKCTNTAEFTFTPEGNQTIVLWTMSGRNNFMLKAFGLFMNMDKMIGKDFEKGLAQMKTVAEAKKGSG